MFKVGDEVIVTNKFRIGNPAFNVGDVGTITAISRHTPLVVFVNGEAVYAKCLEIYIPDVEAEAIKLLEAAGYTITPPKPPLTGELYIYQHKGTEEILPSKTQWNMALNPAWKQLAIVPWTEGQGL